MLNDIFAVGAGGFLGACSRYLLGKYIQGIWKGSFPLGTFLVNIAGSFMLGLLVLNPVLFRGFGSGLNLALGFGFLGSFTTFSTLEYETLGLLQAKKIALAALYVLLSFAVGFAAALMASLV